MANKLKKLISFNVHSHRPHTYTRTKGEGLWLVRMYAENLTVRDEVELETNDPCHLFKMFDLVTSEFEILVGTLSPITDAGYTIYQKV